MPSSSSVHNPSDHCVPYSLSVREKRHYTLGCVEIFGFEEDAVNSKLC